MSNPEINRGLGAGSRGFTLLEVMVSLFIISIGLLGIAKIHALAYSSTATAGTRSLVALQAAGLASSMHADRSYWSGIAVPPVVTISTNSTSGITTITPGTIDSAANTPGYCVAGIGPAACTNDLMAAYDLHTYAAALNSSLGNSNPSTTINCAGNPVNCTIQVTWDEKAVSIDKQSAAATLATTFKPTYTLYVEP